jgi:hypothetical protein
MVALSGIEQSSLARVRSVLAGFVAVSSPHVSRWL